MSRKGDMPVVASVGDAEGVELDDCLAVGGAGGAVHRRLIVIAGFEEELLAGEAGGYRGGDRCTVHRRRDCRPVQAKLVAELVADADICDLIRWAALSARVDVLDEQCDVSVGIELQLAQGLKRPGTLEYLRDT